MGSTWKPLTCGVSAQDLVPHHMSDVSDTDSKPQPHNVMTWFRGIGSSKEPEAPAEPAANAKVKMPPPCLA